MQPALSDPLAIGQLEGFTHQASLICIGEYGVIDEAMNAVYEYLSLQTNIEFGVSKTVCKGFIVRILGYKAEQLHNCLKKIAKLVQENITTINSPL
jgi:urease accessory protein